MHGYKELTIPAAPDGSPRLGRNALHIWPRGGHMMIALPNPDGSFTCTLFWPFGGPDGSETIDTEREVEHIFARDFADAAALVPDLAAQYLHDPTSALDGDVLAHALRHSCGPRQASGSTDAPVPYRYRTRVGRYGGPTRHLDGLVELNYSSYLRLLELLDLQTLQSIPEEHDELLFITIHQVTELWLKRLLHELDKTRRLTRARRILKVLVEHMDVLETMTPLSFSAFRHRLQHASGFQPMQFREIEFVPGYKRPDIFESYPADLPGLDAARARLHEPSLNDCRYDTLERRGMAIAPLLRARDPAGATEASEAVEDGIAFFYLSDGEMRVLFELLTDVDECVQEWRYRHVKMVECTIDNKPGTGGSSGVAFLKSTLFIPAFPDLWAMRHRV